ncbi:MAG: guanylate kinase [Dissulfuribacterales bacterium]
MISAPSGTGKTTLCRRLIERVSGISFSVSYTTRNSRQGEFDGVDYYFVSRRRFKEMISADDFLEWARVYDNFYGTRKSEVLSSLERGKDVLLDIDVQGARQVHERLQGAILIFLLPPSWSELEERLKTRGTEDYSKLKFRMASAKSELEAVYEYDFAVINDDISRATEDLKSIVIAQRCKTPRTLTRQNLVPPLKSS